MSSKAEPPPHFTSFSIPGLIIPFLNEANALVNKNSRVLSISLSNDSVNFSRQKRFSQRLTAFSSTFPWTSKRIYNRHLLRAEAPHSPKNSEDARDGAGHLHRDYERPRNRDRPPELPPGEPERALWRPGASSLPSSLGEAVGRIPGHW